MHHYVEPYTDHEQIGRLVLLRPLLLGPWHSGVPHIYVARATRWPQSEVLGFAPDVDSSPEKFGLLMRDEIVRWTPLVKAIGIRLD